MPRDRTDLILKILRPIAKAYEYPPLSWIERAVNWCAQTNVRLGVTMVVAVGAVAFAVIFHG